MISIEKCIAEIEFRFPCVATHPSTSEEWQTLKAAVLDQQSTNKHITPDCLLKCGRFDKCRRGIRGLDFPALKLKCYRA
jgi:hypothetical protein